jgi:hypothetical protein
MQFKAVRVAGTAIAIVLLLCAVALPALAAQEGPINVQNVLVTSYHDAEMYSGSTTTLQIKVENEAGQPWTSVQVRIDPQETSYLSPHGTNIVDFQSLTAGETRTEEKVVSIADDAPTGEYHFDIYIQLDDGEWTFLMLVTMNNTQGIDMTLLALVIGIAAVLAAAIIVILLTRRSPRRRRKTVTTRAPPKKKKKRRPGSGPQIVGVHPRGEEEPPSDVEGSTPEVEESEEEIL